MHTSLQDRLTLERELRDALDVGEFSVVYQPIFDLQQAVTRSKHSFDGTIQHEARLSVNSSRLLEETGLIVELARGSFARHASRPQRGASGATDHRLRPVFGRATQP